MKNLIKKMKKALSPSVSKYTLTVYKIGMMGDRQGEQTYTMVSSSDRSEFSVVYEFYRVYGIGKKHKYTLTETKIT